MSCRFGERTQRNSRIECARSNSSGLNAETKKFRHRARRRGFSLDIPSYRTFPAGAFIGRAVPTSVVWVSLETSGGRSARFRAMILRFDYTEVLGQRYDD